MSDGAWLGELLAVIHCDGGHYQSEHGSEKATKDAIAKRNELIRKLDAAAEALRHVLKYDGAKIGSVGEALCKDALAKIGEQ